MKKKTALQKLSEASLLALLMLVACSFTNDIDTFDVDFDKTYSAEIKRVINGDTMWVSFEYEKPRGAKDYETIRLIGVDARGDYEDKAIDYLSEFEGDTVDIEIDKSLRHRGRNGELYAYVWFGGEMLNRSLVRKGLSLYNKRQKFDGGRMRIFEADENDAKRERRGLWFEN